VTTLAHKELLNLQRRASASRMDSGSARMATSDATFNLPGNCNPGGRSANPGGSGAGGSGMGGSGVADPMNPTATHGQSGSGSCANQATANGGFGGFYPFGEAA